jgi:UDP-N-acetylglucosamine 2-epimerase (non-hydrolysing)/GDP/UDP-N,N'-diacetylbacillosamine 2-epimerase (hydrolysing)
VRTIGVATVARSDYGSCLPVLRAVAADPGLKLHLVAAAGHLSPAQGETVRAIEADGFPVADRVDMLLAADTPGAVARGIGLGTTGFAQSFERTRPDILLVVGDRCELLSVACAALPFGIPLAHVSGGEITEGAFDEQVRHALTKMSHLHFVAMPECADRVVRMGEEPWRVTVTGDPALDAVCHLPRLPRAELAARLGVPLAPPVVVATYHPVTRGGDPLAELAALTAALAGLGGTVVFTAPNADPGGIEVARRVRAFVGSRPGAVLYPSLGQEAYYSLLAVADVMVGNSSSGIWEAPSFGLPAVNLGARQHGRHRAANVIDVPEPDAAAVAAAIRRALDPRVRAGLRGLVNPYGDGTAAPRIVDVLKSVRLGPDLVRKRFHDGPEPTHWRRSA